MIGGRYSVRREYIEGIKGISVVPVGSPVQAGTHEVLVARSFQSGFRKAMDLAHWGGEARLSPAEGTSDITGAPFDQAR